MSCVGSLAQTLREGDEMMAMRKLKSNDDVINDRDPIIEDGPIDPVERMGNQRTFGWSKYIRR